MVFCGAESGSDEVLQKMNKGTTTAQILEVAARARAHGIIPEFSFVFGDPDEPEREIDNTLAFVRRLKDVNPAMELITYFYTPTPQRRGTYGDVDALAGTPDTLEEWIAAGVGRVDDARGSARAVARPAAQGEGRRLRARAEEPLSLGAGLQDGVVGQGGRPVARAAPLATGEYRRPARAAPRAQARAARAGRLAGVRTSARSIRSPR